MIAYRAETALVGLLRKHLANEAEARALIRELFVSSADQRGLGAVGNHFDGVGGVRDKKVILDMKWSEVGPKEGRNVSAHADDEPIRGPKGLVIVISSSRRTRFAAP